MTRSNRNLGIGAAVTAALMLTTACTTGATTRPASVGAPPLAESEPAPASDVASLCQAGEKTVFSGNVQDDFGLGISVCVDANGSDGATTISIRSEGEGGGTVVSCKAGQCEGVIGMQHYTRYRVTMLTLEWMDRGQFNRIVESFNAEDPKAEPAVSVTSEWASVEMIADGTPALEYPVVVFTEPLSLMDIADILPAADWPEPALP